MKKFFFTAIAMVAFTGVSMANTIEESKIEDALKSKVIEKPVTLACEGIWASTRIYALNQGFTPDQASCIAMAALINCLGINATEVKKSIGTLC